MSLIEKLDRLYKERHMEVQDIFDWGDAIEEAWPKIRAVIKEAERVLSHVEDGSALASALLALDDDDD